MSDMMKHLLLGSYYHQRNGELLCHRSDYTGYFLSVKVFVLALELVALSDQISV